jgi:5'-methylthioadenosine phosphorylase
VFLLARHGAGHVINPSQINSRANIFALKQLGVTHILASGAVGSLREELRPRDLVVPDQVIDKTFRRAGTFYEKAAVHVEFAEPFCPVLRRILMDAAAGESSELSVQSSEALEPRKQDTQPPTGQLSPPGQPVPSESSPEPRMLNSEPASQPPYRVHDRACYICMEGPAFSTRAESLMHRLWGGDLIGMTAMPEAKLAREAEIPYALIALVTDYDCWRIAKPREGEQPAPEQLLQEIIGNVQAATANAIDLIQRAVRLMAGRTDELLACPARSALKLAIWSNKGQIDPQEVQRLAPLWMKYFEQQPAAPPPAADVPPPT